MQVKIVQIGNSYGVRLPKDYIRRNKLTLGQYIHVPNNQLPIGNLKSVIDKAQEEAKRRTKQATIDEIVAEQRAERATWQKRQQRS